VLPNHGIQVQCTNCAAINNLYFQEIWTDNRVILLFRAETKIGDFSGFYDNKLSFFYSPWNNVKNGQVFEDKLENFVLEIYALLVTEEEVQSQWKRIPRLFEQGKVPLVATGTLPVISFYTKEPINGQKKQVDRYRIFDKSSFQKTIAKISPYIRKLPEGAKASEAAMELARQYHYVLREGETFVRPFEKGVYRKSH
jgi:hypothetical protein